MSKPLSQLTADDLSQIVGAPVREVVREAAAELSEAATSGDYIEVYGYLDAGYYTKIHITLSEPVSEGVRDGLIAIVKTLGLAPERQAQDKEAKTQNLEVGGCKVHGRLYQRPAFRGSGYECAAYSSQQEPWTRQQPSTLKNGEVRWYCASRWE